ncbi:MAG TPA: YggT family protein [Candidatus Aquicultor sp.]|jgi:uncharacterized protein YggT (Ycf19 family)
MERIDNQPSVGTPVPISNPALDPSTPQAQATAPAYTQPLETRSNKAFLVVDYIFWILVAVTLLRFAFKLIGANSHNAFVTLIFNFTDPVVNIFKGIVGDVTSGTMVIEFSSLISIVILWLIYKAALRLIVITK